MMTNTIPTIEVDAGAPPTGSFATRAAREELANSVTHGLGLIASIAGAVILVALSAERGNVWHIVSSIIFGATLILLYAASTAYHSVSRSRLKARLRILDHCAIYLLIAGTYTPFTLVSMRGGWGWALFGIAWGLAAAGIVFKLFFTGRMMGLSTTIYLAMGWLGAVGALPLIDQLAGDTITWLVVGGLFYTVGIVFFVNRRLPYAHAIWHLFVLGGSVSHAIAVATQIV